MVNPIVTAARTAMHVENSFAACLRQCLLFCLHARRFGNARRLGEVIAWAICTRSSVESLFAAARGRAPHKARVDAALSQPSTLDPEMPDAEIATGIGAPRDC